MTKLLAVALAQTLIATKRSTTMKHLTAVTFACLFGLAGVGQVWKTVEAFNRPRNFFEMWPRWADNAFGVLYAAILLVASLRYLARMRRREAASGDPSRVVSPTAWRDYSEWRFCLYVIALAFALQPLVELRKTLGSPRNYPGAPFLSRERQPDWANVSASIVAAAGIVLYDRSRLKRDRVQGLCYRCGYDLRATPTRCPECGVAVPMSMRPRDSTAVMAERLEAVEDHPPSPSGRGPG